MRIFIIIALIFTLNANSNPLDTSSSAEAENVCFSIDDFFYDDEQVGDLSTLAFTGGSFNSYGSFKEQCEKEAKMHPQNIKLNCNQIRQFNNFLASKKNLLESAAIFSELYDIQQILEDKQNASDAEKASCKKVFDLLDQDSCSKLVASFENIQESKYKEYPLFPQNKKNEEEEEEVLSRGEIEIPETGPENTTAIGDAAASEMTSSIAEEEVTSTTGRVARTFINSIPSTNYTSEMSVGIFLSQLSSLDSPDKMAIYIQRGIKTNKTRGRKLTEAKKKDITPMCNKVYNSTKSICDKNPNRKVFSSDNELFRKFFAAEFAKTLTGNPDKQREILEHVMLSVNYLICSKETFDPSLTFGEAPNISEITPEEAFTQKDCSSATEIKAFFEELENGALSNVALSEEVAKEIEKESEQQAREYIESDEGRKAIAKAYEDAGMDPPEYLNESRQESSFTDSSVAPTTTPEQTISQDTNADTQSSPSSGDGFNNEPSQSNSFSNFTDFDLPQPDDSQKETENKSEIKKKKEEAKTIEEQFARNIAQGQEPDSEQNQKLIEDLKRLEEEMKELRAENKRLAEQRKIEQEALAKNPSGSQSSSPTGSSNGQTQTATEFPSAISPASTSGNTNTSNSNPNLRSFGSTVGEGSSTDASSPSSSNTSSSYAGESFQNYQPIRLEEVEKNQIREEGEVLGEVFDRDREVTITFISVKDKEGFVTTYKVEKDSNGEEIYTKVSGDDAYATLMALSPRDVEQGRVPASESEPSQAGVPTEKSPASNAPVKEEGMLDRLRNLLE